ncbi:MAG TPA: hypothetical protein VLL76_03260 [Candidatus Omnitrophota bacterium]|nr:hypothetical protein [Candidatus Omnitrophota bacterium]
MPDHHDDDNDIRRRHVDFPPVKTPAMLALGNAVGLIMILVLAWVIATYGFDIELP